MKKRCEERREDESRAKWTSREKMSGEEVRRDNWSYHLSETAEPAPHTDEKQSEMDDK